MYVTSCLVEIPLNLIWCKQSIICPQFSGTLNIVFLISVPDIIGNHVVFSPVSSVCDYRFSHHELFNQLERLTCYFFSWLLFQCMIPDIEKRIPLNSMTLRLRTNTISTLLDQYVSFVQASLFASVHVYGHVHGIFQLLSVSTCQVCLCLLL